MSKNKVQQIGESLLGLKLSIARRAADMRVFHFGHAGDEEESKVGQYALHIQCPWRIDGPEGIITGRSDLWEHISGKPMPDKWEPGVDDNIQDMRIGNLLGGFDARTRSHINNTDRLVVEGVQSSHLGDLKIDLTGGYHLILFPGGSIGEAWRLFEPGRDADHLVVEGGSAIV
jgi:hypothetical protein